METKLNILVLYHLGIGRNQLAFLNQHIYCLKNYAPQHTYLYHNVLLHSGKLLRGIKFDAIVLDVTVLGLRWATPENFQRFRDEYDFLGELPAVKIALPQDEYDCHILLDNWLADWKVNTVFSVLSKHWNILYPRYSRSGNIKLAYTGYIDESLLTRKPKPFAERTIDIGYRAKKLPPYFGHLGETKWRIGEIVQKKAACHGLKTNIAVGDQATLLSQSWYDFIENCKFTLGANSGSSLLDPYGEIQRQVRSYLSQNPDAGFSEIEKRFFPGMDGLYEFTAISPRILEAAMLESCQILVRGEYSGLIEPWKHYIPIREDGADFADVMTFIRDTNGVLQMIQKCKQHLLAHKELRYASYAERIIDTIAEEYLNIYKATPTSRVDTCRGVLRLRALRLRYAVFPIWHSFKSFLERVANKIARKYK